MMNKNHIDKRQMAVLVALVPLGSYFLVAPRALANFAGPAGWLGIIGGLVFGVIVALMLIGLHRRFPSRDVMSISEVLLGRWLGKSFSLIFFGYTLFISLIIREFAATILTPFLSDSPIGPVLIIMTVIISYLAYSGIQSIARTAQVFLPFIVVSLLFILITSVSAGDLGRLKPLLGKGWGGLGLASINAGAVFGEIVVFMVILSHLRRTKDDLSALGWGLILAAIPLALITIGGVALYGYQGVTRLIFPAISIARTIRIGGYFERLEAIFIIIWFILSMLKIGLFLYTATVTVAGILELQHYQPLVLPTAILLMLLALLPETDASFTTYIDFFTMYSLPLIIVLPGLLLLVAVLRNKKDPSIPAQEEAKGS